MHTHKNIYSSLRSYENLLQAFLNARKHKTLKPYIIEFQKNLKENLLQLQADLIFHFYQPKQLETFIIRDPKTRKISKSDFRDRIVHHAIINILEPIFDKSFIYDSYANRKGKGVLKAIARFDSFKRKVSKNNTKNCYILKADIKHYFETVNHNILIKILQKKIQDEKVIWLVKQILNNFQSKNKGIGMPLGNLTSQFFANIYLNELDKFVKHKLRAKYYIRYVDDFVIFETDKNKLEYYKKEINNLLKINLNLELHKTKSKIKELNQGINFLGFRIFYYYKLLKKKSIKRIFKKILVFKRKLDNNNNNNRISYNKIYASIEGWVAYASTANVYKIIKKVTNLFEVLFYKEISDIEVNRLIKYITL